MFVIKHYNDSPEFDKFDQIDLTMLKPEELFFLCKPELKDSSNSKIYKKTYRDSDTKRSTNND